MCTIIIFTIGAAGYPIIELLWRGYTHWSMQIAGGVCFLAVYKINEILKENSLFTKCVFSTLFITVTEFAAGIVLNLILKWDIWNYSDLPCNLLGQICLDYVLLWFLLSIPIIFTCKAADKVFTKFNLLSK